MAEIFPIMHTACRGMCHQNINAPFSVYFPEKSPDAFYRVINKYHPKYFVHGHMHMNYGRDIPREDFIGDTKVINAYERYVIEI